MLISFHVLADFQEELHPICLYVLRPYKLYQGLMQWNDLSENLIKPMPPPQKMPMKPSHETTIIHQGVDVYI